MKKFIKWTFGTLSFLAMALFICVWILLGEKISTLASLQPVDGNGFFRMEYCGSYGLDAFLHDGISSDKELAQKLIENFLKWIPVEIEVPESLACSTFIARTANGDAIMGRNMDLKTAPALFLKTKPKGAYKSISMVNLEFLGYSNENPPEGSFNMLRLLAAPYVPLDGMNEKGLTVSVLVASSGITFQDSGKKPITTTLAIRMLLDKAATVEEAVNLLKKYDMRSSLHCGYHFIIADKSGASTIVEYQNDEMKVFGGKAVTNIDLFGVAEHRRTDLCHRYKTIMETLSNHSGTLSENDAMKLLRKISFGSNDHAGMETQWSVVYNMERLSAKISAFGKYKDEYSFKLD